MDVKGFQVWLSAARGLTVVKRAKLTPTNQTKTMS